MNLLFDGIRSLNTAAAAAGWTILAPGEAVPLEDGSRTLVVCAASWDPIGLETLNDLAARDTGDFRICFLDLDSAHGHHAPLVAPGALRVAGTPFTAEYAGRELSHSSVAWKRQEADPRVVS